MAFQFILPDIGEGVVEGEVVRWHVKVGDPVKEDQTIVEIMTDKATVQIPSPKAGKIAKLHFKEGEVAKVGKPLLEIDTGAGEAPAKQEPAAQAAAPQPRHEQPAARASGNSSGTASVSASFSAQSNAPAANVQPLVASTGDREVLATPAVRKLARDEGVDLAKIAGTGPFGRITREDVLRTASGGQVISFTPPPVQKAQPSQTEAPARQEPVRHQETRGQQQQQQQGGQADTRWDREQPRSNDRFPREQADAPTVRTEQPRQERNNDRNDRGERDRQQNERNAPAPQQQPAAAQLPARQGLETRQPIRGLRKRIAEKMRQSKSTAAHFTYVEEFDLTDLVALRDELNVKLAKSGTKVTFLPFIVKAVVAALRKFPQMNSHVDDARGELVIKHEFSIGVATQTDDGLMVPVVKNADQKSIVTLGKEIAELSEKARKRQASSAELSGSTFTITSLGQVGGLMATPVINYPEVAIMGVHAIKKKPWVVGDQIVIRDIAHFSGSFDHRLIDGYIGAQFIAEVKRLLEDPQTLLLEA